MKKLLLLTLSFYLIISLVACSTPALETPTAAVTPSGAPREKNYKPVEKVGEVPAEFKSVIENDLLRGKTAFKKNYLGHTLKDGILTVTMYDRYGNVVGQNVSEIPSHFELAMKTATSDNGFMYVIGIRYDNRNKTAIGEDGEHDVYAKIVKCNRKGEVLWETVLEDYTYENFMYCYQNRQGYYFFGEKLSTEYVGERLYNVYSDIIVLKLDFDGKFIKSETYGDRNDNRLRCVHPIEQSNSFTVNINSSSGGTFPIHGRWTFNVDSDLEMSNKNTVELCDRVYHIGVINGKYITRRDVENYSDYPGGAIFSIMDHGDFYLVVSRNITGVYEKTSIGVNTVWNCSESVYSAYSKDGTLLWRDSVDSTPDYDARIKEMEKYYGE